METVIFAVHIIGATITSLLLVVALYIVVTQKVHKAKLFANAIAGGLIFQVVSGFVLNVAMGRGDALAFCRMIMIYASVIGVIELLLIHQANKHKYTFSHTFIGTSFVGSIVAVIVSIGFFLPPV